MNTITPLDHITFVASDLQKILDSGQLFPNATTPRKKLFQQSIMQINNSTRKQSFHLLLSFFMGK